MVAGGRYFQRLRANQTVQAFLDAFLDGAGPAAIGAIAGSAIPLGLALGHLWQLAVLGVAAVWLLALRHDMVSALLGAAALRVVAACCTGP